MTDKQRELFQKMCNGTIGTWVNYEHFCESQENGYFRIISKTSPDWEDYNTAWDIYTNSPLMKALK